MKKLYQKTFFVILFLLATSEVHASGFFSTVGRFLTNPQSMSGKITKLLAGKVGGETLDMSDDGLSVVLDSEFAYSSGYSKTKKFPNIAGNKMGVMGQVEELSDQYLLVQSGSSSLSIQPHGHMEEQRSMSREEGYDARGSGISLKFMNKLDSNWRVSGGLMSDVLTYENKNSTRKSHVKSKVIDFNASWKNDNYFMIFGLSGGWNRTRGTREVVANTTWASQSHEGVCFLPRIGLGHQTNLKNGWYFMPYGQIMWVSHFSNKYTEEGAGANNEIINRRHSSELDTTLGVGFYKKIASNETWKGYAGINLSWINRLPLRKPNIKGQLNGQAVEVVSSEKTVNRVAPSLFLKLLDKDGLFASVQYASELGTRFHSHSGAIQVGKKF